MTVMGYEPSVADIPAIIKIKMREERIKMIFLPINLLYCSLISALFVLVPDMVSVLDVIFVRFYYPLSSFRRENKKIPPSNFSYFSYYPFIPAFFILISDHEKVSPL